MSQGSLNDPVQANLNDGAGVPVLVGQTTAANSLPLVIASDQSAVASKNAAASQVDGHSASIGATTDLSTADTLIGRFKNLLSRIPAALITGRFDVNLGGVTGLEPATSGTITILNGSVGPAMQGMAVVNFNITGTWVATLTIQASVDSGATFFNVSGIKSDGTIVSTLTANDQVTVPCGGYSNVKLTATSFTSGTVSIAFRAGLGTNDSVLRTLATQVTDGINGPVAVKAPSTAPVAADKSLVISVSPNSLPLSTQLSGFKYSSVIPDPINYATTNSTPVSFDKLGRLEVHATSTGDKGSFRDDFTGSSITSALSGTLTFTNNLTQVTGSGTGFTLLAKGQWIKKTADVEAQYVQISSIQSDTALTLTSVYTGSSGASTGVVSNWQTLTATGGNISVTTSLVSLVSGVTSGQSTYLRRDVGVGPYIFQQVISISQRIVNQIIFIGIVDDPTVPTTPTLRARVEFTGTINTQCTLVTSSGLLAGDIQSTTVTLPNAGTTATLHNYRIEQSSSRVSLIIDNIRVATHDTHLPSPYTALAWHIGITNTGVPASSTTVVSDVVYFAAYERTQIDSDFIGESITIQGADGVGVVPIANPLALANVDASGLLRTARGLSDGTAQTRDREDASFAVVATAVALANNKSMLSIFNTDTTVRLRIIAIWAVNSQTAAVTGVLATFELRRLTGAVPSAGTDLTTTGVEQYDTTDAKNANWTVRTGATVGTEATKLLKRVIWSSDEYAPGAVDVESADHAFQALLPIWSQTNTTVKPIILRQNEGITVKCATNTTAGTWDIFATVAQET